MIHFPNTPEIDILLSASPLYVSQAYNIPLDKVQAYKDEVTRLLEWDDETLEKFLETTPLSKLIW